MPRLTLRAKTYDVFLGYHKSDRKQVEIIAARLDEAGLKTFLDEWHLGPGDPWHQDIETVLDHSATCAIFLGPSGLSPWQNEALRHSLDERIRTNSLRVIPVLLENATPVKEGALPETLRSLVWVDLRSGLNSRESFSHLVTSIQGEKNGTLTRSAFHQLLNWFAGDSDGNGSGGQKYEEMRQKLIGYFDRRNCRFPEDLADETLNRVAQKLAEQQSIDNLTPAQFCFIKAKQVLHEYWRRPAQKEVTLTTDPSDQHLFEADSIDAHEHRMDCLDRCLQTLARPDYDLILRYYLGEERVKIDNRQQLAKTLGISSKTLVVRAVRIRKKLEECVERCIGV